MSTRRLAAIMFTDIVGYTAMMQENEAKGMAKAQVFRQIMETQVKAHHGELLEIRGDGSLSVFNSAVDAVACAKEIQETLREKVPLRIGIHLGDIVQKDGHIFGDAVNIASRIESMGVAGAVLVSSNVRNQIKNKPEFELNSLGRFSFKNVEEEMSVYALANKGFTIPRKDEIKGKLNPAKTRVSLQWMIGLVTLLLIGLISIFSFNKNKKESIKTEDQQLLLHDSILPNSIAILPFVNMSSEEENQYFTDGIHSELLTHLSKIGDMKVISHTSVNAFRNTEKTSPQIAKELKVANLLEGSVRRADNWVRISVQLVRADTDENLWSENYDRELNIKNIFNIQTEIAKEIASILKTTISPQQKRALEELPTSNLGAYEAFLKARQLMEIRNAESLYEAKALFEEAIDSDPNFAIAYIHLGGVHALLPFYSFDDQESHFQIAREYLNQGMAINPIWLKPTP
ncbi:MAG: adenylate/guanylate cyclase domain-containing protein [Bacteroidia bacterium]